MVARAVSFAGPFRIRDVHYDPAEVHPRHGHDEFQISIVLRGTVEEDAGGGRAHGCAGDIVVKPRGLMHANAFNDARIVCLDTDASGLDFPLPGYAWHRTVPTMTAAMRLIERLLQAKPLEDDVDDLLAIIPSPVTADRRLARRACRILDECFREPLSVRRLAQDLGVHRVYLARVFRLQWDCSPRDYVQRLRVRAATGALASTGRALAEIALEAGFADQSHMTRIFRRRMGITPAAFRRLAQT